MKKLAALAFVTLTLAGCSAQASETPSPTPTTPANANACEDFADATSRMANAFQGGDDVNDAWEAIRVDMDSAALTASGDVKGRLTTLVDAWPKASQILVYRDWDEINANIESVQRACAADGADVAAHTFE